MALDDILKMVPIDDIAEKFGVSSTEAAAAVERAGGTLLGGLAKNAQSDEGSAAIERALKKHEGTSAASKVDEIDVADGDKIVRHILGEEKGEVADRLSASQSGGGIDFGKLLPILAPIVMGLIANRNKDKSTEAQKDSGGGLGDLLGGLLGGGDSSTGGGFDVGSIISGIGGLFGKK